MNKKVSAINLLFKFFSNYIWIGVVILLISSVLEIYYINRGIILNISILFLNYIGVAIIISSIFSFASGTSSFLKQITNLLESIVIKKNFLSKIDDQSKKEILKTLLEPSIAEKNNYPNIGNYFGNYIEKALDINANCVRSNYSITTKVSFNNNLNKIEIHSIYSYRLYPSSKGFSDIVVGFEDQDEELNICNSISVCSPSGYNLVKKSKDLIFNKSEQPIKAMKTTLEINKDENLKKSNHVDIHLDVIEHGKSDFALIQFKALQPTDGFKYCLFCDDDLLIKDIAIFVTGASFLVEKNETNNEVIITCNQWINEGSGVSILITRNDIK